MVLPFTLPDWVPWWVNLVILVPALLFALAFLFMPFSVIGVKSRLEGIEARMDELQGEIRSLALRLPEFPQQGRQHPGQYDGPYEEQYAPVYEDTRPPPIPPAPRDAAGREPASGRDRRARAEPQPRVEPRFR